MGMTRADVAREIIWAVLREHPEDTPERRKALRESYPWGERAYHPYKVWCRVLREMTGRKKPPKPRTDQYTLFQE